MAEIDWAEALDVALAERCVDAHCHRPRSRHSQTQAWRCWQVSVARSWRRGLPPTPLEARESAPRAPKGAGNHYQVYTLCVPPELLPWLDAGKLTLRLSRQELLRRALRLAMAEVEDCGWAALSAAEDFLGETA